MGSANATPTPTEITTMERLLTENASKIQTRLGSAMHGHPFLTISGIDYLAQSGHPRLLCSNVLADASSAEGVPFALDRVTTEELQVCNSQWDVFTTYVKPDGSLRDQVTEACEETFIRCLCHAKFGYSMLTCWQIMNHLITTYRGIKQMNLDDNELMMKASWSPPTKIEVLFN